MPIQKSWNENDFEQAEVFIPELASLEGKSIKEVQSFITNTYAGEYHLASASYGLWTSDFPEKAGYDFKTGLKYFFFGSNLSEPGTAPTIPYRCWENSGWWNGVSGLIAIWSSSDRAVLLKEHGKSL